MLQSNFVVKYCVLGKGVCKHIGCALKLWFVTPNQIKIESKGRLVTRILASVDYDNKCKIDLM